MGARTGVQRASELIYAKTLLKLQQRNLLVLKQKRKEDEERRAKEARERMRRGEWDRDANDSRVCGVDEVHFVFVNCNWADRVAGVPVSAADLAPRRK